MTNKDKAFLYDSYVLESDRLQRENSKLKSEYAGNIPYEVQKKIDQNNKRIGQLVILLENLFRS